MTANKKPGYDPRLKIAAKEIRNILEKHQVAGSINLASDTHGEVCMYFPRWSLVQLQGNSIHIGLRAKEPERSNASVFMLMALRDSVTEHAMALTDVTERLIVAVEAKGGTLEQHGKFADWVAHNWEKASNKT